jgi:hypothetical protein
MSAASTSLPAANNPEDCLRRSCGAALILSFLAGPGAFLPYRLPLEFDSVSTMDNAIKNAIGHDWIADLFVPVSDGHLTSRDHGAALIAIIADFKEVAALVVF